ncbi:hypothetical protein RZS08_67510, partial [Arthrospira platensis SPKY1]|nr:hypothetical protein [Arthrospira platensis SPKY1]
RELGDLQKKYNYNFAQTIPGEVVGAGYDFAKGLADNYDIILQGAGLGATIGALGGSFALLPGSLVGAKIGAVKGGLLGVGAAQLIDTYKQSSGAVYEELQS